ncbi:jg326, partial [Pararge aegeria aegeria]
QFVTKQSSGAKLAIIDGFTYYCAIKNKKSNAWRCTKGGNCKARFTFTSNNEILRCDLMHDHPRPRYLIRDGVFIKI